MPEGRDGRSQAGPWLLVEPYLRKRSVLPHIWNRLILHNNYRRLDIFSSYEIGRTSFDCWRNIFMFPITQPSLNSFRKIWNLLRRRLFSSSVGWTDLCFFIISSINWKLRLIVHWLHNNLLTNQKQCIHKRKHLFFSVENSQISLLDRFPQTFSSYRGWPKCEIFEKGLIRVPSPWLSR